MPAKGYTREGRECAERENRAPDHRPGRARLSQVACPRFGASGRARRKLVAGQLPRGDRHSAKRFAQFRQTVSSDEIRRHRRLAKAIDRYGCGESGGSEVLRTGVPAPGKRLLTVVPNMHANRSWPVCVCRAVRPRSASLCAAGCAGACRTATRPLARRRTFRR